jgi:mycothiol system anti-sigma-R factor
LQPFYFKGRDWEVKPCDEHRANILLYLDNELRGKELEDFRAHILVCEECRSQLEEEQALSDLLHRSRPLYAAPETVRNRVSTVMLKEGTSSAEDILEFPRKSAWSDWSQTIRNFLFRAPAWRALAAAVPVIVLCLIFVPAIVHQARAASYVDAALAAHQSYVKGSLPLEFQSDSPEAVTAWLAGKLPFHFQLPTSQQRGDGKPSYRLTGARLVSYKNSRIALVSYEMNAEKITLLVASNESAAAAGGDIVRSNGLVFHYHNKSGYRVITWMNEGRTYALVSSLPGSAGQPCLVCHQNMADQNKFN